MNYEETISAKNKGFQESHPEAPADASRISYAVSRRSSSEIPDRKTMHGQIDKFCCGKDFCISHQS